MQRRDASTDTAPTTRGEDQQTTDGDALTRGYTRARYKTSTGG